MNEDKSSTQIPLLRFLNKHKWRIILPLIFALFYFALPRYFMEPIAVQQNVFFKSDVLDKSEISKEFSEIRERVLSEESLENLIIKYDLYQKERENNTDKNLLVSKLRKSVEIRLDDEMRNKSMFIWIHLRKENAQSLALLADDVMSQFEKNPNIHIDKYVSEPYDANSYRNYVFFGGLLQGLLLISIPLILLWEIPNMFYSPKTKKMVFEPLKADWQEELIDAKMRNQTWKALQINIRYSYAFIASMLQKSPLGDLVEFFGKFAR